MLKRIFSALFLVVAFSFTASAQHEGWDSVYTTNSVDSMIYCMGTNGTDLFVFQSRVTTGPVDVLKATNIHGTSFTVVSTFSGNSSAAFAYSAEDGGRMFASAYDNGTSKDYVMMSTTGSSWTNIGGITFGSSPSIYKIIPFKGTGTKDSLYVFANTGAEMATKLFRTTINNLDPLAWSERLSLDTMGLMFGYEGVGDAVVFHNELYFSTLDDPRIFKTADGVSFTEVLNFTAAPYSSFHAALSITKLLVVNDSLYFGTHDNTYGAQIWRTPDGINYTLHYPGSVDLPMITSMEIAGNNFYVAYGSNLPTNHTIKMFDKKTAAFVTNVVSDGFGISTNTGTYSQSIAFKNRLFHYSYADGLGAMLWRTCPRITNPVTFTPSIGCSNTVFSFSGSANNTSASPAYSWLFSGSSFGTAAVATYTFGASGTKQVNFKVYNGDCVDSVYASVTVANDISINGTVKFLGTPITDGFAKLFKIKGPFRAEQVDSVGVMSGGVYSFSGVSGGKYIIYAKAKTALYPNALGTYYGGLAPDTLLWQNAYQIEVDCSSPISGADIDLKDKTTLPGTGGSGAISGKVTKGANFGSGKTDEFFVMGDPIPGVDISLEQNPGGIIVNTTSTNASGDYSFTGVPAGNYRINVSIPGIPVSSMHTTVISGSSSVTNMDYVVDSNSVFKKPVIVPTGVTYYSQSGKDFMFYPNPAAETLFIEKPEGISGTLSVRVVSVDGREVIRRTIQVANETEKIELGISSSNVSPGVYSVIVEGEQVNVKAPVIITGK